MALGRKSWLFAGSERGADRAAFMATLIMTCLCRARHNAVYADRRTMPINQLFANVSGIIAGS
ncbi:hypothetical protein [Rhizobium leguminosarum]|uniref:Uncharacterized protein n=1 Tax=Rhizobium leguminosarum TaxID=384 RepID=A0A1B1CMC3_RHILE|nr:hypothetical protein BA011_33985 [Rhizobium leguminosarum]